MKAFLLPVLSWLLLCMLPAMAQQSPENSPARQRADADKLAADGNWADALKLYEVILADPEQRGDDLATALHSATNCVQQLGKWQAWDGVIESAIAAHPADWQLLSAAASLYQNSQPWGTIVSGEFQRATHAGGTRVSSEARDRVRSLQLYAQALPSVANADAGQQSTFFTQLAASLSSVEGWKLQALTDLSQLPDYDENAGNYYGRGRFRGSDTRGAPVNPDGSPVTHAVPATWQDAKSDGERYRWALSRLAAQGKVPALQADLAFARFLHSQFGVQTMASYWRPAGDDDAAARQDGILSLETLTESETVARLANGVKRFPLPDEFNHIAIYRRLLAGDGEGGVAAEAVGELAQIFLNRRQYPKAAAIYREALAKLGERSDWQSSLDQIVNNLAHFDGTSVQTAGTGATLGLIFRNAEHATFTAKRIDFRRLLADTKVYLKSNPTDLDWQRMNIGNIGYRILEKDQEKYIGEEAAKWELDLEPRPEHRDRRIDVTTPLQTPGAWWVEAKVRDGNSIGCVVWITDTAIVRKAGVDEAQYYVVDAKSGAPVEKANLEFFGFQQKYIPDKQQRGKRSYNILTRNFSVFTGADGELYAGRKLLNDNDGNYQWLVTATTEGGRFAHMGFDNVWMPGASDQEWFQRKIHLITDRPVYRPGQDVHWKAWARTARYDLPDDKSLWAGKKFTVTITNPKNEKVIEKTLTSDKWGGMADSLKLEEGATLGVYRFSFDGPDSFQQQGTFRVEEYKKPEYEVKIDAPSEPVMLGEAITAKVTANYYFGAPVTSAQVKYKIQRSDHTAQWYPARQWDWFYGPGYWWWSYDYAWYPGWRSWGCKGPVWWWWPQQQDPPELVLEGEAAIGADGTLTIPFDTAMAKELHPDTDHRYEISVEVTDESRRTILGSGEVLVARRPFSVVTWTDRGHYEAGDTIEAGIRALTLDKKGVLGRGRAALLRIRYDAEGKPTEQEVAGMDITTDGDGMAAVKFSATEAGQYRISASVSDGKARRQEGGCVFVIRGGENDGRDYRFAALELVPDKTDYAPGESVKLLVNTERPDSTVYLFVKASSGICPHPQVLHLTGKSQAVTLPVALGDMPNFFVEAFTVRDGEVHSAMREVAVPPAKRTLTLEVLPDAQRYKPRDTAKVQIRLTDADGKPWTGSTVVTVYDKSLEYISGGSNVPDIRAYFWKWRRSHNQNNVTSLALQFPGLNVPMDSNGWSQLGSFGGGSDFGNGRADIYFKHTSRNRSVLGMVAAESAPAPMASMAVADAAGGALPAKKAKDSPDGEAPGQTVMIRSDFADSAFWTQALETDAQGIATVEVPLPDNLTTWKIKSWAMGHGTKVGEGEAEIITSKDLIIRLQAPRFFVEKDEVTLSANVHNYLNTKKEVTVSMELDGDCLTADAAGLTKTITLETQGEQRVDWTVKAVREGTATVRMKAITDADSDAMQMSYPVLVHGMLKTESWSAAIRPDGEEAHITFTVPAERRPEQSRLEIRYSPSLATAMVDALPYLADYPYGCTEQTLNRFVPAVIARKVLLDMGVDLADVKKKRANLNAQETGDPQDRAAQWQHLRWSDKHPVFDDAEHLLIVKTGLERITSMQNGDGGWGWFSGDRESSWPHTTAVVVHGLQTAKAAGLALLPGTLENGIAWLKSREAHEVVRIQRWREKDAPPDSKREADATDAFLRMVLAESGETNDAMTGFLYRDRNSLPVYAKCLFGLALDTEKKTEQRDMIVKNIEQFLVMDNENQTARLDLRNGSYWWWWYGSEMEANAFYLKLLARVKPQSPQASGLVKFLLNNRKNSTWWTSTRDTAYCLEAMADYIKATGENAPDMTVEILLDGKPQKSVRITKDNLFSFDGTLLLTGEAVTSGEHKLTLRRTGKGPLYANAYLTNFTLEDRITRAGLEVKVKRAYYKLVERKDATALVSGSSGQALNQKVLKYDRIEIKDGEVLKSGDLVEVELTLESKNDYEYLLFEDRKPAGFEPDDVRSGYTSKGLEAYQEFRDDRVSFFVRSLPLGKHNLSYRLRAEIPGKFSALPATAAAMYAPELRGNSDEMKLGVTD